MSYAPRYSVAPNHPRHSSISGPAPSSTALQKRIDEKKLELQNFIALRDMSATIAAQMQQLEQKLSTLTDGTEAIAAVLSNWNNVLRAISMASTKLPKPKKEEDPFTREEDEEEEDDLAGFPRNEDGLPMPHTLVRIPAQTQEEQGRQ